MGLSKGGKPKRASAQYTGHTKAERREARDAFKPRAKEAEPALLPPSSSSKPVSNTEPPSKKLKADVLAEGHRYITQEEKRVYCIVAFHIRFNEPDQSEWAEHAATISGETGMNTGTIIGYF